MNITKYLQVCIKITFTGLLAILLQACKSEKIEGQNTDNEELKFLGSFKESDFSLKFVPLNLALKQREIMGTTEQESMKESGLDFLKEFSPNTPSINSVISNLTKLEADLSKNWIVNASYSNNLKFASLYFKIGKTDSILSMVDEKAIKDKNEKDGITILQVDDNVEEHHFIVFDREHLLLLKTIGNEADSKNLIEKCIFNSKDEYLKFYDKFFRTEFNRNYDLDIQFNGNEEVAKLIKLPIISDVVSTFSGYVGINLGENNFILDIEPMNQDFILDKVLEPFNAKEEQKASLQTKINLKELKSILVKYQYLDDIEYELKKAKLNYNLLQTLSDGNVQASYLGKSTTKEKSVSYAYDDEFNQVEKVVYKNVENHNFQAWFGSKSSTKLKKYLVDNSAITEVSSGRFEFLLGSKSPITFSNQGMQIGTTTTAKNSNHQDRIKLLLALNDPSLLNYLKINSKIKSLFPFQRGSLVVSDSNCIHLNLEFSGKPYQYAKNLTSIITAQKAKIQ
jgi:hypothetical protein